MFQFPPRFYVKLSHLRNEKTRSKYEYTRKNSLETSLTPGDTLLLPGIKYVLGSKLLSLDLPSDMLGADAHRRVYVARCNPCDNPHDMTKRH